MTGPTCEPADQVDDVAEAPAARRSSELERLLRHCRERAEQTGKDPALERETALWQALAGELDGYLRPGEIAAPELFLRFTRGP